MKKTLFSFIGALCIFLVFSSSAFGQVNKMRSTSFSSKYQIDDYNWSEWTEPSESNVLITIDIDNERVTIYSEKTQVYDIAEFEGETTDEDGDDFLSFYCVNEDGLTCRIRFAKLNSQGGRNQIYIDFADMRWMYNVYALD